MTNNLCPLCFTISPRKPGPFQDCPHCESEAIQVALEPLDEFLKKTSLAELQDLSDRWKKVTGFYESYKQEKQKRIDTVIEMKKKLEAA